MIPLYTEQEFLESKRKDLLLVECNYCHNKFLVKKSRILDSLNPNKCDKLDFCSLVCLGKSNTRKIEVVCKNCSKLFFKKYMQSIKHPNHFCSRSCAATYNNTHKTKGTRRSKLEVWLEQELNRFYPILEILYCNKQIISSELDIYIPSLKLAFELNGIFHYEPIYGKDKLEQIKNNDNQKFQACLEKEIELCILDTSSLSYFKPKNAQKYLDIICSIINLKLLFKNKMNKT